MKLEQTYVDFGQCAVQRESYSRPLSVRNLTKGCVIVQWIRSASGRTFHVEPESQMIPPLKSCAFRVHFTPGTSDVFFWHELEAYVYYKTERDHRLVTDATTFPPWNLRVGCRGHTFAGGHEHFMPNVKLRDSNDVVFAAGLHGDVLYKTLVIENERPERPVPFDVALDASAHFIFKPYFGLLRERFHVLLVRCHCKSVGSFAANVPLRLHELRPSFDQTLACVGSADTPNVLLENENTMYLKPTQVGTTAERYYAIENTTRIPIMWAALLPSFSTQTPFTYIL